ncbi:hypothetical protein niasHT_018838 [Heterodera trifolii]|uniref:Uncharacterized protein n=1 Tax=Heterodera trifolii TaxID=157864 RepID=A0ABD2L338_9BILA
MKKCQKVEAVQRRATRRGVKDATTDRRRKKLNKFKAVQRRDEEEKMSRIEAVQLRAERRRKVHELQSVQRKAEEEEKARIEAVQRRAQEEETTIATTDPTQKEIEQIQAVQKRAEEDEMARIEASAEQEQQKKRCSEKGSDEDEKAQIERIKMFAEECCFEMMTKPFPLQIEDALDGDELNIVEIHNKSSSSPTTSSADSFCTSESGKREAVLVNESQ